MAHHIRFFRYSNRT
jgi:phosphatidylserine/phosphatidylglycerophosphate/cardiolipin synthase-like enzyme